MRPCTHPKKRRSAHGGETGALGKNDPNYFSHLLRFARAGQVRVLVDDGPVKAIAVRAGVGLLLASVPPRREGAALAVGRIDSLAVLVLRFFGWEDAFDNGWACVIGSPVAVHEIAETIAHSIAVPGSVLGIYTGGPGQC